MLYGLWKVHKNVIDNYPPFWPILLAIKTPSYNIAKHLVPVLEPITTNKFTIKNNFEFAKEVIEQDSRLFMESLDVGPRKKNYFRLTGCQKKSHPGGRKKNFFIFFSYHNCTSLLFFSIWILYTTFIWNDLSLSKLVLDIPYP